VALLGYARVSTLHQSPDMQTKALTEAGAERIWTDRMSGARDDRPELAALLDYARRGDVLMVWRLDRLGRSLPHLLAVASDLQARGVELRSLTEVIDTTTPGGRLIFHVFGAVAEFERAIAAERTAAGVAAARAAGDGSAPPNPPREFGQRLDMSIPDTFDDPLPEAEMAEWEGSASSRGQ
jgi:DNA invertase Pin-like site-specific DNA recombinase